MNDFINAPKGFVRNNLQKLLKNKTLNRKLSHLLISLGSMFQHFTALYTEER